MRRFPCRPEGGDTGIRLHKRNGTHHGRITIGGREYHKTLKTEKRREAEARAIQLQAEIQRMLDGEPGVAVNLKAKHLLFAAFAKE